MSDNLDAVRVLSERETIRVANLSERTWDRLKAVGDVHLSSQMEEWRWNAGVRPHRNAALCTGFRLGAVGGLMVRGDALDQERTVARAIAAGVNYFDTAVQYGNGKSEKNLGRVLHNLKASDVVVGIKVRLLSADSAALKPP